MFKLIDEMGNVIVEGTEEEVRKIARFRYVLSEIDGDKIVKEN